MLNLTELLTISGVTIWSGFGGDYVCFISDLDVCTDGSGPHHGDRTAQDQTAYYNGGKYLNADIDQYIVVPPQIRRMVAPVVMGCQARLTAITKGAWWPAMVGDIGPASKTGEAAICLAQKANPKVSANVGDSRRIYLYELWPGIPSVVDGTQYKLEPA